MRQSERFNAVVVDVVRLTHDVKQIDLELTDPKEILFRPGQFISFDVPDSRSGRIVTRPYSIASSPTSPDRISLLLNLVIGGPGSTYLFNLREGDHTQFVGPAGNFYLREDPSRNLLFVATGTGIAPIRAMLLAYSERSTRQRATLFWGLRSQRDLYYQDELTLLTSRHPELSFTTTLSRPEPGWTGATGRVTKLVEEEVVDVEQLAVYLCGSSTMIKEVTGIIRTKGLCPIFREQYFVDVGGSGSG